MCTSSFIVVFSVAILKYVSDSRNLNWYPRDLQKRAKVDEYLSWQQFTVRMNASMVFRKQVLPAYC